MALRPQKQALGVGPELWRPHSGVLGTITLWVPPFSGSPGGRKLTRRDPVTTRGSGVVCSGLRLQTVLLPAGTEGGWQRWPLEMPRKGDQGLGGDSVRGLEGTDLWPVGEAVSLTRQEITKGKGRRSREGGAGQGHSGVRLVLTWVPPLSPAGGFQASAFPLDTRPPRSHTLSPYVRRKRHHLRGGGGGHLVAAGASQPRALPRFPVPVPHLDRGLGCAWWGPLRGPTLAPAFLALPPAPSSSV